MNKRRRSRSAEKVAYKRIVLDEMPVAERLRLRSVSAVVRKMKKKPRGATATVKEPPSTEIQFYIPREVVLPKTPLRRAIFPKSPLTPSPSAKFPGVCESFPSPGKSHHRESGIGLTQGFSIWLHRQSFT